MNVSDYLRTRRPEYLKNFEYPTTECVYVNGLITYMGISQRGKKTSDSAWIVTKFDYDADNNFLRDRISPDNSIMDNYASLTYS